MQTIIFSRIHFTIFHLIRSYCPKQKKIIEICPIYAYWSQSNRAACEFGVFKETTINTVIWNKKRTSRTIKNDLSKGCCNFGQNHFKLCTDASHLVE